MPTAYSPGGGRSKSTLGAQQRVGDLDQDAGAVAGVRLGAGGAAVVQVVQRGEALRRRCRATAAAAGVGHEGDAAGVLVVRRVVEAARRPGPRRTALRTVDGRRGR